MSEPNEGVFVVSVEHVQVYTWTSSSVPGLEFAWNISAAQDLDCEDWSRYLRSVDILPLVQAIKESLIDGDPVIDIEYAMGPEVKLDKPCIAVLTPLPWVEQFLCIDGWHRIFRLFTQGAVNVTMLFLTPEQEESIRLRPSKDELDSIIALCSDALTRADGQCSVCKGAILDEPWFAYGAEGAKYPMFAVCSERCQAVIKRDVERDPMVYWESRPGYRGMA